MEHDSIFRLVDYGKVKLDIKTIMDSKNISPNQLSKKCGVQNSVIKRYYNGDAQRYDSDILARICFILNCDICDIISYEKPTKTE